MKKRLIAAAAGAALLVGGAAAAIPAGTAHAATSPACKQAENNILILELQLIRIESSASPSPQLISALDTRFTQLEASLVALGCP